MPETSSGQRTIRNSATSDGDCKMFLKNKDRARSSKQKLLEVASAANYLYNIDSIAEQ